jgi:NTE family protein
MGKTRIGLALGSGGARGSAHVGVLKVLEENHIKPDVIAGTSMGAQIGGLYAAGISTSDLVDTWESISFAKVARTLLPTIPWSGWSSGSSIVNTLHRLIGDIKIEDLLIRYGAVATDLETGLPYTITEGEVVRAIRASLSVPGLFTPVWIDGHLLVDGGVTNPLPVNTARQLGADVVVAVDVLVPPQEVHVSGIPIPDYHYHERILGIVKGGMASALSEEKSFSRFYPSVFGVLFQMSTIFQKRISDLSLQVNRPDVLIRPDFSPNPPCYSSAKSGIKAGEQAARRALPKILKLLRSE